ncbi:hypothetical protein [Luteococcus sanguinis]|uniref:Uncharacterized protein n=1 Tax=Luteococcus sanguinis TaxID=174038 RepID=A0ABW1X665_9ACTN
MRKTKGVPLPCADCAGDEQHQVDARCCGEERQPGCDAQRGT